MINTQVKSNVIRGHRAQLKANMAKVFDEPWGTTSREWLENGKNGQLPIVTGWKIYNLLHAFHPDTYDSWKAVGGRKTDGEYYESYHDDHIVNPSSTTYYAKIDDINPLQHPIDKHVFTFEDFAEIDHEANTMTLHTEYLHERKKSIVEYSLRHDRFFDVEVYDKYREWIIYVKSTKGATKGKGIPFRCDAIITAPHFKDWVYIFKAPDTFRLNNPQCYDPNWKTWKIILQSRDKVNC